jgi:SSS family solute:Na+ symporter
VIAVGIIGSIYALTGGLRTVAVSDTINGVGLLVGGFMITFFALSTLGGEAGVMGGVDRLREEQQTRMNSIGSVDSLVPFGEVFSGIFLLTLFYWSTNQQIIQRTLGASSLAEGQKGMFLTGALKLLGPIYLVLPGMIAYSLFAGDVELTTKQITATDTEGAFNLTVEATANGMSKELTVPLEINQAAFWSKNPAIRQAGSFMDGEKQFDYETLNMLRPAQAYGKLVNAVLPKWLTGFFAAVMLGAILSSFNSALNSSCTLFSLGLYKNVFQNATERQVVASGKYFGIVVAVAAVLIAPGLAKYSSIFDYLQKMNGIYAVPILAVVLVGMLSRRVPPLAAKTALIVGFTVLALGNFVPPFTAIAGSMGKGFYFLGTVFSWLVVMMFVIGELRPTEKEWEQQDVKAVDMTPWRFSGLAGIALIVTVIAIYAWFADF